jgi:hypothetical protein
VPFTDMIEIESCPSVSTLRNVKLQTVKARIPSIGTCWWRGAGICRAPSRSRSSGNRESYSATAFTSNSIGFCWYGRPPAASRVGQNEVVRIGFQAEETAETVQNLGGEQIR